MNVKIMTCGCSEKNTRKGLINLTIIILFIVSALINSSVALADSGTPGAPPSGSGGFGRVYTCYDECHATIGTRTEVSSKGPERSVYITPLSITGSDVKLKVAISTFYDTEPDDKEYVLHEGETRYLENRYLSIKVNGITSDGINFNVVDVKPVSCEETDGGYNRYIKGTTTVTLENGEKIVKTDSCGIYNPNTILIEYQCASDNFISGPTAIPGGCSDGATKLTDSMVLELTSERGSSEGNMKITAVVSGNSSLDVAISKVEMNKVKIADIYTSDSGIQTVTNERSFDIQQKSMEKKRCVTSGDVTSCIYEGNYSLPDLDVKKSGDVRFMIDAKATLGSLEKAGTTSFTKRYDAKDAPPEIKIYSISPEKPLINNPFTINMVAEDDLGIESISYLQKNYLAGSSSSGKKLCYGERTCTATWNVSRKVNTDYTLVFVAADTTGHANSKELTFQVFNSTPVAPPSGPGGGNSGEPYIPPSGPGGNGSVNGTPYVPPSGPGGSSNGTPYVPPSGPGGGTVPVLRATGENKGVFEMSGTSVEYLGKVEVKDSKIYMETSIGKKQIAILPEDAVKVSETPVRETIQKIELKEQSQRPVYSVKGIKQARLLFVIPTSMDVETNVDAETGSVLSVNRPWWSFLAW